MPPAVLPIDEALPELCEALRTHSAVVLRAPTGAGKTTRVPPAILDRVGLGTGRILVLQPRRVAARATAARMASERGGRLGDEIGYQTRFDSQVSGRSRIVCITEGILLRRLLDDPFLDGVDAVVFDEFHERNLASDLSLGMVRQLQLTVRPELRIVVMSATLDPQPIARYLGDCPAVESLGRAFPVAIEYIAQLDRRRVEESVADGVNAVLSRTPGDILVFLPGVGEIRAAAKKLAPDAARDGFQLMELYGDLSPEKQDAVLAPSSRRKVILATNVAETSLTIAGVTGVVDTGLARVLRYDEQVGLDRLELSPISKASAEQRAGRAGRTQPGVCLRLWPEAAQRARADREEPEIRRVDLSGALLQLACWIEPDPRSFPWFESPRETSLDAAERLLRRLEAIDDGGVITQLGRTLAGLPTSPRLARMLLEGSRLGEAKRTALAAAMLSERSPFLAKQSRRTAVHSSPSDVLDRLHALEAYEERGEESREFGEINRTVAQTIFRTRDQLLRQIPRETARESTSSDDAVLRALLAGFPDRVAKRRDLAGRRGLMIGGRGVRLAEESAVDQAELFLCVDVEGSQSDAVVRQASAIRREWLPEALLEKKVDVFFDEEKGQLAARRRVLWDGLLLEESPAALSLSATTADVLAEAARRRWEEAFPHDNEVIGNFIERVRFLNHCLPTADVPSLDDAAIQGLLPVICEGRRSLAEVRRGPWLDHLRGLFSWSQLQTVDREAPTHLTVPSGSRITLQYAADRPPTLAVRIQELFGLSESPRVAGGRIPILFHLLAPNCRPQQITDDLRSFWNNTYPQVRKDLRGRYPKHAWPEVPWNALPQRKPGKRREE